jgi:hypothetical protein
MKLAKLTLICLAACALGLAGCDKKIKLTIRNHTDVARQVQITNTEETMTVGRLAAGSVMRTTLKVKKSDLPAQCGIAADGTPTQAFLVDDDTPGKLWFHITKEGTISGPYGENDEYVETEKTMDITAPVDQRTIVR